MAIPGDQDLRQNEGGSACGALLRWSIADGRRLVL
jgi:hypothetical protein